MSQLRKAVLGRNAKRTGLAASQQDFTPIKWSQYFDSQEEIDIDAGKFCIYKKGNSGPAIVCLHGGGYSGLTWALFAVEVINIIECQIIAIDLRGHGNTKCCDDDLSLDSLANDVAQVIDHIFKEEEPPIVLVGHSMGGAVAVQCASLLKTTVGLCVIDVVEGTALDALSSMQSILRGRPSTFKSIQHAILWSYKGGQTHNLDAAKVSMPGQIINIKTGNLASNEIDTIEHIDLAASTRTEINKDSAIFEEEEEEDNDGVDSGKPPLPKSAKTDFPTGESPKYTWRIDLSKTERFWSGWFKGLSQKFLDIRVPKLLLLANIHGLDTALTVGQMQGKFQLQVLTKSGHAIHEDQPNQVAEIIAAYLVKQKIANAKGDFVCPLPGC